MLGSKDVALDGRHTPALYSRFLSSLLAKYTSGHPLSESHLSYGEDAVKIRSQYTDGPLLATSALYSWPDVPHADVCTQRAETREDSEEFKADYQLNEADMDLSLPHFVRTVTQNFPGTQVEEPTIPDVWGGWDLESYQAHAPPMSQLEFSHWWRE